MISQVIAREISDGLKVMSHHKMTSGNMKVKKMDNMVLDSCPPGVLDFINTFLEPNQSVLPETPEGS